MPIARRPRPTLLLPPLARSTTTRSPPRIAGDVEAVAAVDPVGAKAAAQDVVAGPAGSGCRCRPGQEHVVVLAGIEQVGAVAAIERVEAKRP